MRLKVRACDFAQAWHFSPVYEMLEQQQCTIEDNIFSLPGSGLNVSLCYHL